ncbi:helix-turn-helix domain-containing protein [Amycolatopsis ultiminotia]
MDTQAGHRQQRRKQRTRDAIQDAALTLFAGRGYRVTTMNAIAEAADVAPRTVTFHFPTKADLLFGADPFTRESLEARLNSRAEGESTLAALRDWMVATMLELSSEAPEAQRRVWRRRALRAQVIGSDDELRARARAGYYPYEQLIAAHLADDLGLPADALVPRLAAATSVTGLRELYQTHEVESSDAAESTDALIALVDQVLAFAEAGIETTR